MLTIFKAPVICTVLARKSNDMTARKPQ